MKRIKSNKRYLWNFYVFPLVCAAVTCYPTGKPDIETQPEIRDEKHFPNGTVVGKYTYMDNEGNPIQVKYYADDASYGVELKSIKVVDSTGEPLPVPQAQQKSQKAQNHDAQSAQNTVSVKKLQAVQNAPNQNLQRIQGSSNVQNAQTQLIQAAQNAEKNNNAKPSEADVKGDITQNFPLIGYKYKNDPYDFLNKEVNKMNRYKIEKPNPDYEIYYQNELKGPKKCGNEKVRVYFDQDNRQIRSVDNFETDKFCEQF